MVLDKNKEKITDQNRRFEETYAEIRKTVNDLKTFFLGYSEKWDEAEAKRIAKKFHFSKQGEQWLPINKT